MYSPCATIHFSQWLNMLETFLESILWKPFSSSVAFSMVSVVPQKRCPFFDADFSRRSRWKSAGARSGEYGGYFSVATLFFAKNSMTRTDRCAGALSWRRNQLFVLHFSGSFLLTTSPRRWISLFTVAISVNFTSEFQELSKASTPVFCASLGTNSDYLRDFKLPLRSKWDLLSSEMLRIVDWWLATFRDSLSVSFSRVRELNKH